MESNKFFMTVARVNSLLFLAILVATLVGILFIVADFSESRNGNIVEVSEDPEDSSSKKVELVLRHINEVEGTATKYVHLESRSGGGKFSKRYGGDTRNILFIDESDKTRWLLENHQSVVIRHHELKTVSDTQEQVISHLYYVVSQDTDMSGSLDRDDLIQVSLSRPDGSEYGVVLENITSVIDYKISGDLSLVSILAQQEGKVFLFSISIAEHKVVSKVKVLDVNVAT